MEIPESKPFTVQKKLSYLKSIEIVKEFQPITMERLLAKIQIEIGLSEDLAQKTIKNLIIDQRIICKDGKVVVCEAENK